MASTKNSKNLFTGTGVAIITPFKNDGKIDFPALTNVIEHIIKGKCEYIVVMGTTGESPSLSKEEKTAILQHAIKIINGRVPVVYRSEERRVGKECRSRW